MFIQQPPAWTGDFVKKMHMHTIKKKDIAAELNFTHEYVGKVLNGKERPKDAKERFNAALDELIEKKAAG